MAAKDHVKPRVGSRYRTWFSDREDGMSRILAVFPYTGPFPEHYSWVVRVTAPRTYRGWMELSYDG